MIDACKSPLKGVGNQVCSSFPAFRHIAALRVSHYRNATLLIWLLTSTEGSHLPSVRMTFWLLKSTVYICPL